MKNLRRVFCVLGVCLLVLWLAWGGLTILFANLQPPALRQGLAICYLLGALLLAVFVRPRKRKITALVILGACVTIAYVCVRPSNDRDWIAEVAVAPTAEISLHNITLHGVRNFHYRSESDFDARWEDRTYDVNKLRTLDLIMSYWGPPEYCHTILSFGFDGGDYLAASVEVRKEKGEGFSNFGGFFRMFELIYIFGDERDLIGVRTNHRKEDVYLYRVRVKPERLRDLFVNYVRFANQLAAEPQFYDVLENSCGVNILHRVADTGRTLWVGRAALLNGYWDQLIYKEGALSQDRPFEELRRLSRINERAMAAGEDEDFSARIREGLPAAPKFEKSDASGQHDGQQSGQQSGGK